MRVDRLIELNAYMAGGCWGGRELQGIDPTHHPPHQHELTSLWVSKMAGWGEGGGKGPGVMTGSE